MGPKREKRTPKTNETLTFDEKIAKKKAKETAKRKAEKAAKRRRIEKLKQRIDILQQEIRDLEAKIGEKLPNLRTFCDQNL